ncbi:hypothetical protein B484DRAFT_440881, partial [Ochromonadaceae sp. CCMP2298]
MWTTLPVDARRSIWNLTLCGGLHGIPSNLLSPARHWEIKRACGVEGFEGIMPGLTLQGIHAPNCGPARFNKDSTWLVRWTPGFRHDSSQGMGRRNNPTEPGRRLPFSSVVLSTKEECLIFRDCTDQQRAQLLPFNNPEYAPIKSEFLSLCRDRPDQEHTLSKPDPKERKRLLDRRRAAEKKAAQLTKAGAGSSGLTAWITGGTTSLPKSGATISEEPRRNIKGEISRIPEKPIQGEDYRLTSIPRLKRGLAKEDLSVAQIEQKSRSDSALSSASQEASVRLPTVAGDAGLTMTGWQTASPQGGSAS